ncbi:MAG: cytochrome c [Rhodobacteraceae bacterium]|nr:cytochrome c [Paracoccaceae bacterium]
MSAQTALGQQIAALTPTAEVPPPEIEAWYSDAQADRGQRAYPTTCGGCHGTNMIEIFSLYEDAGRWFRFASGSMPADNPGGLPTEDYLDILAYLMREMGFPAGPDELPDSRSVLARIMPKASREILGYAAYDEQYDPGFVPPIGNQP